MKQLLLVVVLLAGCAAKQKVDQPLPVSQAKPVVAKPVEKAPSTVTEAVAQMKQNFNRIYFPFDSVQLTPDSGRALSSNVEIMRAFPQLTVEVQGHCDDRGTTEYNLALGQRRAEAVVKYMTTAGVPRSRLSTVSFGEEHPLQRGATETAWTQNRRAEFRITRNQEMAVQGTTGE